MAGKPPSDGKKSIAFNKQARRLYHIEDRFEAGIVLRGSEVKSLRNGRVTMSEGYVRLDDGEAWLVGVHIPPYAQANINNHEPTRARKLLLHKRELRRLIGKTTGLHPRADRAVLPPGASKLEFGLGKGKLHDKRQDLKKADAKRSIARALKG